MSNGIRFYNARPPDRRSFTVGKSAQIGPPSYRRCPGGVVVPLTCAGRPWRRLQVGSDGALFGCVTKWQSDRRGRVFRCRAGRALF